MDIFDIEGHNSGIKRPTNFCISTPLVLPVSCYKTSDWRNIPKTRTTRNLGQQLQTPADHFVINSTTGIPRYRSLKQHFVAGCAEDKFSVIRYSLAIQRLRKTRSSFDKSYKLYSIFQSPGDRTWYVTLEPVSVHKDHCEVSFIAMIPWNMKHKSIIVILTWQYRAVGYL